MINNRNDYDFVTIPNDIVVDGGIMPARDVAANGSWKVLRGEDIGFLMEGISERRFVQTSTGMTSSLWSPALLYTLDKVIHAWRPAYVAKYIYTLANLANVEGHFCKVLSSYGDVWNTADSGAKTPRVLYNLGYALGDFSCAENDFVSGGQIKADPVRKLFYDMQILRHFYNDALTDVVQTTFDHTVSGTDPSSGALPAQDELFRYFYSDAGVLGTGSCTDTISSGTYSTSLPQGRASYVTGGQMFGLFRILSYLTDTSYAVSTVDHLCVLPLNSTYANGTLTVASSDMMAAIQKVRAHYALPEPGSNVSVMTTITLEDFYAIWDLGAHTDISDLGWTWQP